MYCALQDSPAIEEAECQAIARNFEKTVNEGRRPGLTLEQQGQSTTLTDWGLALLDQMEPAAALMDSISRHR